MLKLTAALKCVGGANDLFEAPWYLVEAICQANGVLSLLEAPDDWAPPEEILHHPERLKEHFDYVKRKHSAGQPELAHDPSFGDVSEAEEYRRLHGLPAA